MFFFAAPYLLAGVLLHLVSGVSANTEIVNFAAVESVALSPALVALTADWYVILVSCIMIHVGSATNIPHRVGQPSLRMIQRSCGAYSPHRSARRLLTSAPGCLVDPKDPRNPAHMSTG